MSRLWRKLPFLVRMHGTFDHKGDWVEPPNESWRRSHRIAGMYYMIGIDGPEEFEGGYRAVAHHHYDDTTGIGHGARPMQAVLQAVRATGVNDKVLTQLAVQVELDEIAWKMNEVVKGVQRSVGQSLRRPLLDLEGMIGEVRGYMP